MSTELTDDAPEGKPVEAGTFPLTDRMKAIARGEDPEAPVTTETVDEPLVETPTEDVAETVETPEVDEPTSWITDADRNRAKAYGLDPSDLDAYENREQFGSALRAIDKAFSRRDPVAQEEPEVVEQVESAEDPDKKVVNGKLNPAYFEKRPEEYDEDYIQMVKLQRATQDRLDEIEANNKATAEQYQQAEVQARLDDFHRTVDSFSTHYGKTVDEHGQPTPLSPADAERRWKLLDAAQVQLQHIHNAQHAAGMPISSPPLSRLLKDAEFIAFPDEVLARAKAEAVATREKELKKIADQSKRIRQVASTASVDAAYRGAPPESTHTTEAIMRHPEIARWRERVAAGANHR